MDRPRAWLSHRVDLAFERPLRVGRATIDPISRDAEFDGRSERLQPQNLKVLIALARRRGEVVTRADLVDCCWDGRVVGEDVINHSISVLRAFADRAGGFTIETVPKSGYRLVEASSKQSNMPRIALGIVALAAAVAGLAVFASRDGRRGAPPVPVVVIGPFSPTAGDPLSREVARAARVSLSYMLTESGLPVRLLQPGEQKPSADFIISGDFERANGGIEATVRVEETRTRTIIFTHRFDSPAATATSLPDQIGASIATNLSWTAALMVLDRRHPSDPQITTELLKQMSITVEGGDMLRAFEIARSIAAKAPRSAIAEVALAFDSAFVLEDLPRDERSQVVRLGRQAADRAEELAPEFGDAYVPWCILRPQVRMAECENRYRKAMERDPEAPFVSAFLATLMSDTGRFSESLELARASIANDPYKPAKLGRLIRTLEVNGRSEEARAVFERARRWWPTNDRITWGMVLGLLDSGKFQQVADLADQPGLGGLPLDKAAAVELATAVRSSDRASGAKACSATDLKVLTQAMCMIALARLGDFDRAYAIAGKLFPRMKATTREEEERLWLDHPYVFPLSTLSAPAAAELRTDRRFLSVARRTGLLDYWRSGRMPDFCTRGREQVCGAIARGN